MRLAPGRTLASALLATVAVVATACGGSSSGGGTPQDSVDNGSTAETATIDSASGGGGVHLVAGDGRTIYLFEADTGSESTCTDSCAAAWPPVTTGADAKASGAVKAGLLGTTTRSDGSTQVTYAGHPLYLYGGDNAPGDMNGAGSEAFGAEWYPVTTAGEALEGDEDEDQPSPSTSDSGYSY